MKNKKIKGNALLLLTSLIWGISFIAQSKGVELISPVAFNGIRCMLGAIVLLPVIAILDIGKKRKNIKVKKLDKKFFIASIVCGTFFFLATTLQTVGMVETSPGKAGFITALYMIIVPIIGAIMGKKPSKNVVIAVVAAIVGLYLMCIGETFDINKGDILVLCSAFLFAGHILSIDYFADDVDGVKLSCAQFFVSGIISIVYILIFEEPHIEPILNCWVALGYSGIMSCGVAYTLQIIGQKYTDPTSASILMSLESVFSTLTTVILIAFGWELTGGALTAKEIIGCILMFAAIIFVQLPEKRKV